MLNPLLRDAGGPRVSALGLGSAFAILGHWPGIWTVT